MSYLNIYCDGSVSKPRYGKAISACIVYDDLGNEIRSLVKVVAEGTEFATVNVAEYNAVLQALKMCARKKFGGVIREQLDLDLTGVMECLHVKKIFVFTDSKLVVNQLNNEWACDKPHLVELNEQVRKCVNILKEYDNVEVVFNWIPREENTEADKLSKSLYEPKPKRTKLSKTRR